MAGFFVSAFACYFFDRTSLMSLLKAWIGSQIHSVFSMVFSKN